MNISKPVLDQNNIPIEELLGSVTTYNNVDGSDCKSQQLRTSARVFKKMKLDSANSIPTTSSAEPKKETTKEEVKPEVNKRQLRPTWSQEDKNLFFEALNEFGKDFESIYLSIAAKLKRKGLPDSVLKTKDQVRHFYYRTFHKISKHLKFSDDIKKLAQELYALINYGELRKKLGSVSEKTCMKLNELIYRGTVCVRFKGKTIRVKTPMCRALRKLNQLDEKHDDLKLPTRVNVELVAKDMSTWLRIQGISQNPRIKTSLPLQKRLSTLMKFLTCKWQTADSVAYENMLNSVNEYTRDCVPDKKIIDVHKTALDPLLRLSPQPKTSIELPTINLSEYLTSHSICLNAFEERIGVKVPGEQLWVVKGAAKKGGSKRSRNESTGDKVIVTNSKGGAASSQMDSNENCIKSEVTSNFDQVIDEAVNTILSLQNQEYVIPEHKEVEKVECVEEVKDEAAVKEEFINNVRKGWSSQNCGTLSIGELYLMFGSNSKLILEYSWDNDTEVKTCDNEDGVSKDSPNVLHGTLSRLLSIAKMQYRKNIIHCPCGHICNGSKPNTAKAKPLTPKTNRLTNVDKGESQEKAPAVQNSSATPVVIQSSTLFRRPVSPNIDVLRAQLASFQRLQPRYCNRRGRRPRSKQVVVERRLPLLPNKTGTGRQIVQMNIIAQDNTPRSIAPKIVNIDRSEHNITNVVNISSESTDSNTNDPHALAISDNAVTLSRVGSPTSISNLLEMAMAQQTGEILNQSVLENKEIPSFSGLLSSNGTPPTSPSRILKENEHHWLNSEVADFSLSSFLGHLESPMKTTQCGVQTDDNPLSSQDMDAQLQCLLTESSVDYVAKFADLAAEVVSDVKK